MGDKRRRYVTIKLRTSVSPVTIYTRSDLKEERIQHQVDMYATYVTIPAEVFPIEADFQILRKSLAQDEFPEGEYERRNIGQYDENTHSFLFVKTTFRAVLGRSYVLPPGGWVGILESQCSDIPYLYKMETVENNPLHLFYSIGASGLPVKHTLHYIAKKLYSHRTFRYCQFVYDNIKHISVKCDECDDLTTVLERLYLHNEP